MIALFLEGVVASVDHRLLVREAVANLTAELRDNEKELEALFANLDKERQQLEHADEIAGLMLAHTPLKHIELALDIHRAELKNAAVTTGQITGAFGYMEYGEVSRYANVYDLQAQFMRLQEREEQHLMAVLAFVRRVAGPGAPADDGLQQWRTQIELALAGIVDREQTGRVLQKRYQDLLARR